MVTPPGWANLRATFKRDTGVEGVGGSVERVWLPIDNLTRVPVEYKPERGRDRVEAGRIQSSVAGVLRIYGSDATRQITPADTITVHHIGGDVDYTIQSVTNPDNTGHQYEMTVEEGVSLG